MYILGLYSFWTIRSSSEEFASIPNLLLKDVVDMNPENLAECF